MFGGSLHSQLDLPEFLRTVQSGPRPDWTVRVDPAPSSAAQVEAWGRYRVGEGTLDLVRTEAGYRLTHSATGAYDLSEDGTEIVWHPSEGAPADLVAAAIAGPVMALALHAGGVFCLHGSAVALCGEGVAFVAPKESGKSTLAMALTEDGARLLSDDIVALDLGASSATLRPGGRALRLWDDSVGQVAPGRWSVHSGSGGAKHVVEVRGGAEEPSGATPLSAVYVLRPRAAHAGEPAAERTRLRGAAAATALIQHTKLAHLLGRSESRRLLEWASAAARIVPVYSLEVQRDFERLPEVVRSLRRWHTGTRPELEVLA